MWQNFFRNFRERKAWLGIVLPLWVFASFILAQAVVVGILWVLNAGGVMLRAVNPAVLDTVSAAVVYLLTLVMAIGLPWLARKYRTTREDVGLTDYPRWLDLLLAPAGLLVYLVLSAGLLIAATQLLPFVDLEQAQDVGFGQITQRFEYILAFLTLVIIAPVAEEILFRGYLFGKLRKHVPLWIAILITSLLFALAHGSWNVGIDVFALSIVLCLLRVVSKSLWPSILLHMLKNGIAFYILFINPSIFSTLGG